MARPAETIDRSFVPSVDQPAKAVALPRTRPPIDRRMIMFVIALIAISALFLFPFLWLLSASLKTRTQVFGGNWIPDPIQWANYLRVWEVAPFARWFVNSMLVAVAASVSVALSSALVAFGFAYFRFPYRNLVFGLVLATMMLPGAVTMVPTFLIWDRLGWTNTLVPLWAGNLFGSAFYIFLLRQFFLGLPRELFEAARVDGASYLRMWWSIALPLTKAALLVVLIFEFKASWTDLVKPLIYLRDASQFTVPLGLKQLLDTFSLHGGEGEVQLIMAATVIATLPMILIFFLGQRYFIEGIATTGSKG
jgi:multiple sugar transport system permease protein